MEAVDEASDHSEPPPKNSTFLQITPQPQEQALRQLHRHTRSLVERQKR